MATALLNKYLATADRVVGTRTPAEVAYDREVLRWLHITKDLRGAVAQADQKFPAQAMAVRTEEDYAELASRYEYIRRHEEILRRLRR